MSGLGLWRFLRALIDTTFSAMKAEDMQDLIAWTFILTLPIPGESTIEL